MLVLFSAVATFAWTAPGMTAGPSGAIWTTNATGTQVNGNIYAANTDVYLSGGPQNSNCGAAGLPNGAYYFQVTDPSGAILLSTDPIAERQVMVSNGAISGYLGATHVTNPGPSCASITVQLMPFGLSPNSVYKVWMTPVADFSLTARNNVHGFQHSKSKTDNFSIQTDPNCDPGIGTWPNCAAAMPLTKTLNGSDVPTDLDGNPLVQFTFNLYFQNPTPVNGQIVPLNYPGGFLPPSVNFPPDPGLIVPWGVPLAVCDMGTANASPIADGTGTWGSLTAVWSARFDGDLYLDQNLVQNPPNTGAISTPYNPGPLTAGPSASCINFTVPAGTAEFRLDVNNIAPNNSRMQGGGSTTTGSSGLPASTSVRHNMIPRLPCDKNSTQQKGLKVEWGNGQLAIIFELQTLTFAACLDTSIPASQPPANFDTYIGTGTFTRKVGPSGNPVAGYTGTWKFTDTGEGVNSADQATIMIKDSNGTTVVNVGPATISQGTHQAQTP